MNSFRRAGSIAEVARNVLAGAKAGMEVKDFLHEFQWRGAFSMLEEAPPELAGKVAEGEMLDAYLQALAVYLAAIRLKQDHPAGPGLPGSSRDRGSRCRGPLSEIICS